MYEVEIKVELNETERNKVIAALYESGFEELGTVLQIDYYTRAVESLNNAFDIERYRDEGGEYLYTKKEWEVEGEEPVRREDEHPISKEEFESVVLQHPSALKILKNRTKFIGIFEGEEVTFSIDSVVFDHSPFERLFAEPEIIVDDKTRIPAIKSLLKRFMAKLLGIQPTDILEAPGMFAMAYKKL